MQPSTRRFTVVVSLLGAISIGAACLILDELLRVRRSR